MPEFAPISASFSANPGSTTAYSGSREEITRDLPNVSETDIAYLDEVGLAKAMSG